MLERVYAHLLESSAEVARQRLDAFSERLGQEQAIARGGTKRDAAQWLCWRQADDGTRTHDTWLGKPVLYQLSYVREACILAVLRHLARSSRATQVPQTRVGR